MHAAPFDARTTRSVSRRSALGLFAAGTGGLLLAACSGATAPLAPAVSSPVGTASNAAQPAQTHSGGTLRAAIVGDLPSIDGQQMLPGINATVGNAYETLTRYGENLTPQPVLAESWDLSSDSTQIKLNLRKGVTYHDGREFTSDDVTYSLMRLRDPKIAPIVGPAAIQSSWWTTVETPDKSTIILKSDLARPGVFDFFQNFTIVDKNTMEGPEAKTRANGTGPFTFVEWVPGDHVSMARNNQYWRSGTPLLDGIRTAIARSNVHGLVYDARPGLTFASAWVD